MVDEQDAWKIVEMVTVPVEDGGNEIDT